MIDQLQAVEIPECEIEREVSMEATDLPTWLIVSEHADRILEQVPLPVEQRQVRIDTSTDA